MSQIQRHPKERESIRRIARAMKRTLTLLIAALIAILLALLFRVGESWWPGWIMKHRTQTEGIVLFAIICLILLSPIIVEASSNTRTLSGPGKYPGNPRIE
jgi:hypothetical protein